MKIAVVYHSRKGHTKKLAEAVLDGVKSVDGIEARLIFVENFEENIEFLNNSSAIIFGSPTYMGSVSGEFKKFMDSTSQIWLKRTWKNKLAAGFTNSGWASGDKLNTLIQLMIFASQLGMIWVSNGEIPGDLAQERCDKTEINRLGSFMGVMSVSPFAESAEFAPPAADLKTGFLLGERVAKIAKKFNL